jgi:hypothetical protein
MVSRKLEAGSQFSAEIYHAISKRIALDISNVPGMCLANERKKHPIKRPETTKRQKPLLIIPVAAAIASSPLCLSAFV